MIILNDPTLFGNLLTSNDQADIDLLNGLLEADRHGCSHQGILDFQMIYPGLEVKFNVHGQQASCAASRGVIAYLRQATIKMNEHS